MAIPNIKVDYEKSHGSYVYDKNTGKEYLDMMNHYSSNPLGYDDLPASFYKEVNRICHIKTAMGVYDSDERQEAVKIFMGNLAPYSFEHVHFACTGSLAIEAAIKTAWAYANPMKRRVITLRNNFHGINSFGNFVTTRWNDGRLDGVPLHGFESQVNSLEQLQHFCRQLRDDIAAIIIEPIQCTGGDIEFNKDFFKSVRYLCDEQDIVLIFDEIQTGFYATGTAWYFQQLNIEPDIIVFGKKAQVSGILVKSRFNKIFEDPMKLSVTYDGELVDLVRCKYILQLIKSRRLWKNIQDAGNLFYEKLRMVDEIKLRGLAGILAFDLETTEKRDAFQAKCFEKGMLVNIAGERTIRLRPNLATSERDINVCVEIIKQSL